MITTTTVATATATTTATTTTTTTTTKIATIAFIITNHKTIEKKTVIKIVKTKQNNKTKTIKGSFNFFK